VGQSPASGFQVVIIAWRRDGAVLGADERAHALLLLTPLAISTMIEVSSNARASMNTTPEMYFQYFVRENYFDFVRRPHDVRRAFNAAVSAFHMTDVFYEYSKRNEPAKIAAWPTRTKFVVHLSRSEPQFKIVQSVATIYKHMYVARPYLDGASPQSIQGVVDRDGVAVESGWSSSTGDSVTIRRRDGSEAPLTVALEHVVERMWPSLL